MDKKYILVKGITGIVGAFIMDKWRLFFPAIILLIILMIADYISEMLAVKKEALDHPKNKKYRWNSKKSIIGIYKKVSYILIVIVAFSTDFILIKFANEMGIKPGHYTMFSLTVIIWLIINELISILGNAGRMGAKLPSFLKKFLEKLQSNIDDNKK